MSPMTTAGLAIAAIGMILADVGWRGRLVHDQPACRGCGSLSVRPERAGDRDPAGACFRRGPSRGEPGAGGGAAPVHAGAVGGVAGGSAGGSATSRRPHSGQTAAPALPRRS